MALSKLKSIAALRAAYAAGIADERQRLFWDPYFEGLRKAGLPEE
jgi:hypothetical protein